MEAYINQLIRNTVCGKYVGWDIVISTHYADTLIFCLNYFTEVCLLQCNPTCQRINPLFITYYICSDNFKIFQLFVSVPIKIQKNSLVNVIDLSYSITQFPALPYVQTISSCMETYKAYKLSTKKLWYLFTIATKCIFRRCNLIIRLHGQGNYKVA